MKTINIDGIQTYCYTAGHAGPDLLLLHGWASSARMWTRTMWSLRRNYRLWSLDLPGHGRSPSPSVDWYSVERFTDYVAAFCHREGIRPQTVIGHSMGGRIALDLARRYPDLMQRVIAVSPTVTGKLGFNINIFMIGGLGELVFNLSKHIWPIATAGSMSMYWAPRFLSSEAQKRTAADLRRAPWDAAIGSLRAISNVDFSGCLQDIRHPTLIVCGRKDYTIPPSDSQLAAQAIPSAELIMLDRVHHWPSDEDLGTFLEAITPFLRQEMVNGR